MSFQAALGIAALLALVPLLIWSWRAHERPTATFWILLCVAAAGPGAHVLAATADAWPTGFSMALWVSVTASLVVFTGLAAVAPQAWRLAVLLMPYLLLIGVVATIWQGAPGHAIAPAVPALWLGTHIAVSVLTYALLTLAATGSLAVLLRERALLRKETPWYVRAVPSVADSERLEVRLLLASEFVLGLGLLTGAATSYEATGSLLALSHKTIFSLTAFVVIGLLLAAHFRLGLRGRRATRLVLAAYLLLTLAYPGVKFVTDVLLA